MVCADNESFSPSAGKPAAVVKDWQRLFGDQIVLRDFSLVTPSDLALAHDRKFVEALGEVIRLMASATRCPQWQRPCLHLWRNACRCKKRGRGNRVSSSGTCVRFPPRELRDCRRLLHVQRIDGDSSVVVGK